MFPETYGRTLEELAFLFEDKSLADEAAAKVEKQIQQELEEWSGAGAKGVVTHITAAHGVESGSWDGTASGGLVWHDENELRQQHAVTKKRGTPGVEDRFSRWP